MPSNLNPSNQSHYTVVDSEHLQNFKHLPFFSSSDVEFFSYNSFHLAYRQIPVDSHIQHPQNLSSTPTYREITSGSSHSSSSSDITSSTISSLPPLVPISDISETLNHQFIQEFSTLSLIEPPVYTPSREEPPVYEVSDNRVAIGRRIRLLQQESVDVIAQLRNLRDESIAQLSADIEAQITIQLNRYDNLITHLRDTLRRI